MRAAQAVCLIENLDHVAVKVNPNGSGRAQRQIRAPSLPLKADHDAVELDADECNSVGVHNLIGKPFELADAQALLTLLEVALPGVLTKLAQRAAASLKDAQADKGVGGEAS